MILDDPVDLKVRITPDGRCEMTIEIKGKSKVTCTFCAVLGLHHAAQRHSADNGFFLATLDILKELLQLFGLNLTIVSYLHVMAKMSYKCGQCGHLLRVGLFMDTIYEGTLQVKEMFCNRLVCSQHKVLDKLGSSISLVRNNINRISVLIKDDLGFREIKVDGALLLPLFAKD